MSASETDSSDRRRIDEICLAALDRDPAERAEFVRAACGGDAALLREVEALLAHAPTADAFLGASLGAVAAQAMGSGTGQSLIGRTIGPYQVLAAIGAGGMGEVYRARDAKLGRDVAIKVLPAVFTADRDRLARFEREARVLASLNHPNIAAIYGLEQIGDVQALVLELVEGETLAERIAARDSRFAIGDALGIARQIADALEAAHEKGIVHRDLKPANVKVTPAGTVKVLDFGLAKSSAASAPDLSQSPTITISGTREGVLLGTAAYMSPEQARGQSVDKRADIWAFGCVLFEMLTGRIPFPGATVSDHIAAILEREPDWSAVPASTPAAIRRLLKRCLEKDPRNRLHDIADARIEIEDTLSSPAAGSVPSRRASLPLPSSIAAVLLAMLVGSIAWNLRGSRAAPSPPQLTRFAVMPPATWPNISSFAVSPDGSQIVFAAQESAGTPPRLFLRRLDQFDTQALAGTEGGSNPFFSPDGQWIGFGAESALKKVSTTSTASPLVLAAMPRILGATWTTENSIIVGTQDRGLQRVPATGGPATPVTTLDAGRRERDHHKPELLPGGKALLFTIHEASEAGDVFRVGVQSLASGERRVLIDQGFDAHYLPTGHLIYASGNSLLAVPFDAQTLEVSSSPVKLLDNVATVPGNGFGAFSVSKTGSLVFVPERSRTPDRALVWVDRTGTEEQIPIARQPFTISRLSPDGRQIAFTVVTSGATAADVWTYDIATNRARRASFESYSVAPIWTPDGTRITYTASEGGVSHLMTVPADGSRSPQSLVTSRNQIYAGTWTPDGRTLLYLELLAGRIQIAALDPDGVSRPVAITHGPAFANVSGPAVSPDGRWLALVGTEKGRDAGNIYVEPFQRPGPRYQVTVDGGIQPLWRRDGREIFYRNGDGMYAVPVEASREFNSGKPVLLFSSPHRRGAPNSPDYDVSPDGSRFLMVRMGDDESAPRRLNVVLNWVDELTRRVPTAQR